jgi:hypothetical protein
MTLRISFLCIHKNQVEVHTLATRGSVTHHMKCSKGQISIQLIPVYNRWHYSHLPWQICIEYLQTNSVTCMMWCQSGGKLNPRSGQMKKLNLFQTSSTALFLILDTTSGTNNSGARSACPWWLQENRPNTISTTVGGNHTLCQYWFLCPKYTWHSTEMHTTLSQGQ